MNQLELILIVSYLFMTCYFLGNWVAFSLRHPTSTPEDKFLSFIISLITTIFWPVIVPMSFIEIFKQGKLEITTVIPIILFILSVTISYIISVFLA